MKINDLKINHIANSKDLAERMLAVGFQATNLGKAVKIIKKMKREKCTIFLTFTANMVASGLRGLFAHLCKEKFIDVIITTAGAIEHDVMKSIKEYELGDFIMDDAELHKRGINRIGNILVSNEHYIKFEEIMQKTFEKIYVKNRITTPREIAEELGKSIEDKNSFLYHAGKNNIPVFCPGIVDGAIGLQAYFFRKKRKDFVIDVGRDLDELGSVVLNAEKTGGIILGGGISKHHALGANLLRGGFDYAVYLTTAQPWDGSLSGARTTEAVSWGKIKEDASQIVVDGDATITFPLILAGVLNE